jgi:hypothetical protein
MNHFFLTIRKYLGWGLVITLPWQARLILLQPFVGGFPIEYMTISIYAWEILGILWLMLSARGILSHTISSFNTILTQHRRKVAGVVLLIGLNIFFAHMPIIAGMYWFRLFFSAWVIYTLRYILGPQVWGGLIYSLIIQVCFALWQVLSGTRFASTLLGISGLNAADKGVFVIEYLKNSEVIRTLRGYGTFSHPNIFGGYMLLGLILLEKLKGDAFKPSLVRAMLIFGALLSFSRAVWLGLIMYIFLVGLNQYKVMDKKQLGRLLISMVLPIIIFTGIFFSEASTRVFGTGRLESMSNTERIEQVGVLGEIIGPKEILIGTGLGNYTLKQISSSTYIFPGYEYQPVHNTFLLFLAELGVLLGAAFIILSVAFIRNIQLRNDFILLVLPFLPLLLFDHFFLSLREGLVIVAMLVTFTAP